MPIINTTNLSSIRDTVSGVVCRMTPESEIKYRVSIVKTAHNPTQHEIPQICVRFTPVT